MILFCLITVPPEISSRTNSELVAIVGRSLFIDCEGRGDPPPNITWYQNGQPLVFSNTVRSIRNGRYGHVT